MKRDSTYPRQAKPKEGGQAQPLRVHKAAIEKRSDERRASYIARKNQPRTKAKEDLPFRPRFRITYKELLSIPGMADKLRFPPKSDRNLGSRNETWCEFHKGFGYDVEHCITLGYQLADLVKDGFFKEYLEGSQEGSKEESATTNQGHEVLVHGELNTISGGGCSASKRKKYAREVMAIEARRSNQPVEPDLWFTSADLSGVIPHEDDPIVISVVTVGRRVHRVLIDTGSSVDVMFWITFNNLQLSPNQLRPYDGCLFGFAAD